MATSEIFVDYEWGALSEIFVGFPVQRYPDVERAAWMKKAVEILPKAEADKMFARSGMNSRDIGKFDAMEAECQELISIFKKFDVTVRRPGELNDELVASNYGEEWLAHGWMAGYSRDCMFVVGDNVIELATGTPMRRADMLAYREVFQERIPGSGAKWIQMPVVDVTAMTEPGYSKEDFVVLEGGDLFAFGDTVFVGTSLNPKVGSSTKGVEWIRALLEPQGYSVVQLPLREEILHLDIALSLPREGVAVLCPDAFVDGIPTQLADWDLVEVTIAQARHDACNGLPINSDNYIVPWSDHDDGTTVQHGLEALGITCHRIKYDNHHEDGGSIRCTTHPLRRRVGSAPRGR